MDKNKGRVVLHVDNEESDVLLSRFAFKRAGVRTPVIEMRDGEEAVDYLTGRGKYGDRARYPLPCVIIMDLSLPGMDGFELLGWLNEREEYREIPRLVLTGSEAEREEERKRAKDLGCSGYFQKPFDLDELVEVIRVMEKKWISASCPEPPASG